MATFMFQSLGRGKERSEGQMIPTEGSDEKAAHITPVYIPLVGTLPFLAATESGKCIS